jgi:hypothetical protein
VEIRPKLSTVVKLGSEWHKVRRGFIIPIYLKHESLRIIFEQVAADSESQMSKQLEFPLCPDKFSFILQQISPHGIVEKINK